METPEVLLSNGTTLPGQGDLTRSIWDGIAALESGTSLDDFRGAIRSMTGKGAFQPELDLSSTSNIQSSQASGQPETASQVTSTNVSDSYSLFPELVTSPFTAASDPSSQPEAVNIDSLTGSAMSAPLASTQAIEAANATAPPSSNLTTIDWNTAAPSPIGRTEAQGAVVDGKLYVFGGFTSRSFYPTRRSDVYDPATNTWTRIANLPKPPQKNLSGGLTHAGIAANDNNIYIAGGYGGQADGSGQIFGSKYVWKYDVSTKKWTGLPSLPEDRAAGELSLLGQELHYFGGTNLQRTKDTGDHWALNLNNPSQGWVRKDSLPNPRNHLGDTVLDGKIYAIGGQHGHDDHLVTQASVHAYNSATDAWTAVKSLPRARSHISGATFVMDGRIIVAGGEIDHGSSVRDVTAYDPQTDRWTTLTPLPAARYSGIAKSIGDEIFYTTGGPAFKATTHKGMFATNQKGGLATDQKGELATDQKINFQPDTTDAPTGYIKDTGKPFDASRGYGWVRQDSLSNSTHTPLDISPNTRDRNRTGFDSRLNTLIHLQGNNVPNFRGVKIPAAWEYALPNGQYNVTVGVGDRPFRNGVYDSLHKINVEGKMTIQPFQSSSTHEYELGTTTVNVADGRLTVDAIGGTNTKINYVEIKNVSSGEHPNVSGSSPAGRQTGVIRNAAINLDVDLRDVGAGVDADTLTTDNIRLYRTRDNALVPGNINTSGGGDAIVYQPNAPLNASTHYTVRLTDGVKDQAGNSFLPFTTTFTTGTANIPKTPGVNFDKTPQYSGKAIASLAISPDNSKLYATSLDGSLLRWSINPSSGKLTNPQTLSLSQLAGRTIVGITFDPANSNIVWLSHNAPLVPQPAKDFTGKISKLTLESGSSFNANIQDYVVGLPRSAKDHLSNSLAFHNDLLYLNQGSNSAMGAPDNAWYQRSERLLNATVLQINPRLTPPTGGFNVQTEPYGDKPGNYNPNATNAPVKIYATGVRNAYDLVWHSNGSLYIPANGSAAGGNTPNNPNTSANEGLTNVATQSDYLFKVAKGGYYGHPNPKRNEYIMNGGNPTSGKDPAEVVKQGSYNGYPVGTQPDPDYKGFAYDFGRNRSPDGAIEYQSNLFNGALKNKLLVVEYSGGDDILALTPGANGNILTKGVTQVASGFENPLDLVEDTRNGNLYVAELVDEKKGQGQISLLSPDSSTGLSTDSPSGTPNKPSRDNGQLQVLTSLPFANIAMNRMVFSTVNEEVRDPKPLTLKNTGTKPLTITKLAFGDSQEKDNGVRLADHQRGADFKLVNKPALPLTIQPGQAVRLSVQFAPQRTTSNSTDSITDTLNGENYASLTITSNDSAQPIKTVNLAGLNLANYEGNDEPSAAEVARIFGWTLNVGSEKQLLGGDKKPLGDEVYSPYWLRADTSKPVYLWPLAVTSSRKDTPHGGVRFEAKPGSGGNSGFLYQFAGRANDDSPDAPPNPPYEGQAVLGSNSTSGGENQKLLPKIFTGGLSKVRTATDVDFTPTKAFALNNGGSWTDDSKNGTGQLHNWRMYPVRNAQGDVVPDTWFAIQDKGNTEGRPKNYDYQDHVYLLVNAKPESAALNPQ